MRRFLLLPKFLCILTTILTAGFFLVSAGYAEILTSGEVNPLDPGSWTDSTWAFIGENDSGALSITGGSTVRDNRAFLGDRASGAGLVTVEGEGSTWIHSSELYVGVSGTGELSILNGGNVSNTNTTIGYYPNSSGTVTVDSEGSTWSISGYNSCLDIGKRGSGKISITNGGIVSTVHATIGSYSGSSGIVTVDGEGSSLLINSNLFVGDEGAGELIITNGGSVSNPYSFIIGFSAGSIGSVTVAGKNSKFDSNSLSVGLFGTGQLSITSGGTANADSLNIKSSSTTTIDVNSSLKVGTADNGWTENIDNDGTIRLVAGAGAAPANYSPMSYGTMDDTGIVRALGGIWDETAHTITVSEAVTAQGASGATAFLDLSENQRALIVDTDTGKSTGAAFQGAGVSAEITFTATAVTGEALDLLEDLIADTGEDVFSIWDFSVQNYDSEVYLSLSAKRADNLLDLTIWYLTNDIWTEFDATGLALDGTYASFTATELGTYAVTGSSSVPVPGAIGLFGAGLLGLVGAGRKN